MVAKEQISAVIQPGGSINDQLSIDCCNKNNISMVLTKLDTLNTKKIDMGILDFMNLTEDIAIDLGTANTLIIHNDKVVVNEPSIVAMETKTGKFIEVGVKAQQMHGKAHKGIETTRPLKDGVIADFDAAESMIKEFIKKYLL